jgi:negative regulator of flagellin synthesis FlgM
MKLGNPDGIGRSTPVGLARSQTDAGKAGRKLERTDPCAAVELSDAAARLRSGDDAVSPFDAAKVACIAQTISDGSYRIDAEAIADKLIADAQECIGRSCADPNACMSDMEEPLAAVKACLTALGDALAMSRWLLNERG